MYEDAAMTQEKIITADIGGTNGRFAVVAIDVAVGARLEASIDYNCSDFASFGAMMRKFLSDAGCEGIRSAHLAVAAETTTSSARFTNIDWCLSSNELQQETGLDKISFLNDFAAVGSALPYLKEGSYTTLKAGVAARSAPISVVGPGTGFGVALLTPTHKGYQVFATEGGHSGFSPTTPLEQDLCKHLSKSRDHVCVESLLSGRGLVRIHEFLVEYAGSGPTGLKPAEISQAAADGSIASCVRAVQIFFSVLGSVTGDIALIHGAKGGVWFAGGIIPKIQGLIADSDLIARFGSKGIMSNYLKDIPINIVTDSRVALLGAAYDWLSTQPERSHNAA